MNGMYFFIACLGILVWFVGSVYLIDKVVDHIADPLHVYNTEITKITLGVFIILLFPISIFIGIFT